MLGFKPAFSTLSLTFIKRLFSSSSLSAIRVVSSEYLRLLIFLPAILIPACASRQCLVIKRKSFLSDFGAESTEIPFALLSNVFLEKFYN